MNRKRIDIRVVGVIIFGAALFASAMNSFASAYKDSPRQAKNPATDISDFYTFRSWEDPDKIVFIVNVNAGQNPQDGPALSNFDDDAIYRINIDNNMDGSADDIVYEIKFRSRTREVDNFPKFPFSAIAHPQLPYPELQAIESLSGPGSEGLRVRQTFTVKELRAGSKRKRLFRHQKLISVPKNLGEKVMPDYEGLASQGIYSDSETGIRVFTGQRADLSYVDLGAITAGLDFRRSSPFLSEEEDTNDFSNPFGENRFEDANVNSIVIEIPISRLTADGQGVLDTAIPFIGSYANILQPSRGGKYSNYFGGSGSDVVYKYRYHKRYQQVSRMANPTFNILVNDYKIKDKYNMSAPENDGQYQDYVKNAVFANYLSYAIGLPVPPTPRLGILSILYKYPGQPLDGENCGDPCADLLHLNIVAPPTAPENQSRLGALLSPDIAGLPNGRRPNDDVYDISIRAFGGPAFIGMRVGDGVNFSNNIPGAGMSDGPGYGSIEGNILDVTENGIVKEFPFLPTAHAPL